MGLFDFGPSKKRLYKTEKVSCPHCKGTGSCTCGADMHITVRESNCSLKRVLGIDCLCFGICDSCKGKGFHIVETYQDVLTKE